MAASVPEDIARAVALLEGGGVVAFPTETVYGVGALTSSDAAIDRIYRMKGRPRTRALIVHIADAEGIAAFADDVPDYAFELARAFWPGPLTLVLRRRADVPAGLTGGADTIGLRVPRHDVALSLLAELGRRRGAPVGIAAPSANRFGEPPPTTAEAVITALSPPGGEPDESPDMILDGGPCAGGVPSLVLSCVGAWPRVLRRGTLTIAEIEGVIGRWVDT
ncbi:MAG: L-threonylcarbamoyladenylate synthase [Nannocystaceae bacterium]|jgi:L-threonylcarbamoyladenylate synthase